MTSNAETQIPIGHTAASWLLEIQNMCRDMNLKVPATLAEARRPYNQVAEIPTDTAIRTRFATPGQVCGRGRVRKISDRQLNYLRTLLNTRYYRSIMAEKWFTALGATSHMDLLVKVEFISLKGASTMIDALKACPLQPSLETQGEDMASEAQKGFLVTLLDQREHNFAGDILDLTKAEASQLISSLKDAPRKATPAPTKDEIKSVAGLYELDGGIYRMKKARNGNHFYAELLVDRETGAWEYAKGFARKVPAEGRKMSLEEGGELSNLLGGCCMCGRTLTATVDGVGPVERFIGPICEAKYFG